jgi:[acyl-carrier-protein] S-malonyltransferase
MSLPVSGAFHTPFMSGARDRLREAIAAAKPRDSDVPIVSNVDAKAHNLGEEWSTLLSAQLSSPVRWRQCLLTMSENGISNFVELGPGGVLTGMAKRTLTTARTLSISTPDELDKLIEWIGESATPNPTLHEGEHLFAVERLVVSPTAGVFTPKNTLLDGTRISVGDVLGMVGDHEVRSLFDGVLQNFISVEGERVTAHQPIAWLRTI